MNNMRKLLSLLIISSLVICACAPDDESSPKSNNTTTSKVEKPTITVSTAVTSTTDFEVVFKVTSREYPSVTLHYGTTSSCNKSSSCRLYRDGAKTRFYKAAHTGFSKGTRIYFYGEATNSGGTSKTSVDYRITKR